MLLNLFSLICRAVIFSLSKLRPQGQLPLTSTDLIQCTAIDLAWRDCRGDKNLA